MAHLQQPGRISRLARRADLTPRRTTEDPHPQQRVGVLSAFQDPDSCACVPLTFPCWSTDVEHAHEVRSFAP